MAKYAATTEVSVEKSRMEIETTLRRYGADAFSYGWEEMKAVVMFRAHNRHVRFLVKLPDRDSDEFKFYYRGSNRHERTPEAAHNQWEQACRQKWRALVLVVKAKLEAVDAGISEFEEEFLANIVLPEGGTVGQFIRPRIEEAYLSGKTPPFLMLGSGD